MTQETIRQVIMSLSTMMADGELPADLPNEFKASPEFIEFVHQLTAYQQFAVAMANGDLSLDLKAKGRLAEDLQALQAQLRHLTWQTQHIAEGDLSQRVSFMGDFSTAFNKIVENIGMDRNALEQKSNELSDQHQAALNSMWDAQNAREELEKLYILVQKHFQEIQSLQVLLKEQAIRDPLTGLYNRRYLEETFARELARADRENYPICLVMLDIDHFKQLNDTFGHQAGDEVLRFLAKQIQGNTRINDIVCRFGGEEIVVISPNISLDVAEKRFDEFRRIVEAARIEYGGWVLNITFSAGISTFPEHARTGEELIQTADFAMYQAKSAGRNRVECFKNGKY